MDLSIFNPQNSLRLFGFDKDFSLLSNLYLKQNLPNILMFSGNKGSGKFTFINHFLFSVFDLDNYDIKSKTLKQNSNLLIHLRNNVFPNIIYINGSNYKSVKVDDIRYLKSIIQKSTISDKKRFIILDDIEVFNINSLNALLKILEEPTKNNYFFLINNKTQSLLDTITSRSLEIKIILNEQQRLEIINNLINSFEHELYLDPVSSKLTPGNFIKFNYICKEHNIDPQNNFIQNFSSLISLYKKKKDILYINLLFFITDFYFNNLILTNNFQNDKIYETKNYIIDNLNKFLIYNLNQNSLLNVINNKLKNE